MLLRSIATVIAVAIACVLFPRSDADARGGGGFHAAGMRAAFHMSGGQFGGQHGRPPMHGDIRRAMHANHLHNAERSNRDRHGGRHHFARAEFGRWHRRAGFGSSRMSSIADGQWHAGGKFR